MKTKAKKKAYKRRRTSLRQNIQPTSSGANSEDKIRLYCAVLSFAKLRSRIEVGAGASCGLCSPFTPAFPFLVTICATAAKFAPLVSEYARQNHERAKSRTKLTVLSNHRLRALPEWKQFRASSSKVLGVVSSMHKIKSARSIVESSSLF